MLDALHELDVYTPNRSELPIIEVPLRDHTRIDAVGRLLFERGIYVTLAVHPLVPKAEVGFRIQLTAANTDAEVDELIAALRELAQRGELRRGGRTRRGARRLMHGGLLTSDRGGRVREHRSPAARAGVAGLPGIRCAVHRALHARSRPSRATRS